MSITKKQILKMALRLRGAMSKPEPPRDSADSLNCALDNLKPYQESVRTHLVRLALAEEHGWQAARRTVLDEAAYQAERLSARATRLAASLREQQLRANQTLLPTPSLGLLVEEMRGLEGEFEGAARLDLKEGVLAATTEAICLEEVELGRFEIQFSLKRLKEGETGTHCFRIQALEANPASGNDDVTHPHVKSEILCAGDATGPLRLAIQQGRILDAFVIVRSVLRTYNSSSPHVPLSKWNDAECHDCGSGEADNYCESCGHDFCGDCMSTCQKCERDLCSECMGSCEKCGNSYCTRHLEACSVCDKQFCEHCLAMSTISERQVCEDCRESCTVCENTFASDELEEGLCEACREKKEEEDEEEAKTQTQEREPNGNQLFVLEPSPGGAQDPALQPGGVAEAGLLLPPG